MNVLRKPHVMIKYTDFLKYTEFQNDSIKQVLEQNCEIKILAFSLPTLAFCAVFLEYQDRSVVALSF